MSEFQLQQRAFNSSIDELYARLRAFSSYMANDEYSLIDWINKTDFEEPLQYYIRSIPHYRLLVQKYKEFNNIVEDWRLRSIDFMEIVRYPPVYDEPFVKTLPKETLEILDTTMGIVIYGGLRKYFDNVINKTEKYNWWIYYHRLEERSDDDLSYSYSIDKTDVPCILPKTISFDITEVIKHNKIVRVRNKLIEELVLHPVFVIHLANTWDD